MKKTITGLVLVALIFAPSFASAASKATSQFSVQTSTDASSSINLKKMTKKQLQKLIKDAKKELASRKVKKVSTGSSVDQTITNDEAIYEEQLESARTAVNDAKEKVIKSGYPGSSNVFINKAISNINEIDEYKKDNPSLWGVIWMAEEAKELAKRALRET